MIPIRKGREPNELLRYRLDKSAGEPTYENMPADVKEIVLESLMRDQGYLCAYCMCRIPQDTTKHWPPVTIEHINPQSCTDLASALDYRNMLAVCSGNRNPVDVALQNLGKERLTCDAHRQNTSMTVNPLLPYTLMGIKYKSDGTIYSVDENVNRDLDGTLNLNRKEVLLKESRKAARDELLVRAKAHTADFKSFVEHTLEYLNTTTRKPPFAGVLIEWLEKKRKQWL